jgi:hypothetical protein
MREREEVGRPPAGSDARPLSCAWTVGRVHGVSIRSLLAEVDVVIDNGLWDTIRGLVEDLEKPIESLRTMVLAPRLFGHESDG